MSAIDDIKQAKGYILGLIAFATGVATFLTQVWHFKLEPTIILVAAFSLLVLAIGFLIHNSEKRQSGALKDHIVTADKKVDEIQKTLGEIKDITIENQKASLRIEMNNEIKRHPENHDTILRLAERYFCLLSGDWVQTDVFLNWVDAEKTQGRIVHVPSNLLRNVETKNQIERAESLLREQRNLDDNTSRN